jgi:bifunctional DNase/RNase
MKHCQLLGCHEPQGVRVAIWGNIGQGDELLADGLYCMEHATPCAFELVRAIGQEHPHSVNKIQLIELQPES